MKLFLAPLLANGWMFAIFFASAWETSMTLIGVEVGAPPSCRWVLGQAGQSAQ